MSAQGVNTLMKKLILSLIVFCIVVVFISCSNANTSPKVQVQNNNQTYMQNQQSWYPVDYLKNYPERIDIEDKNLVEVIGIRANAICTSGLYNFNSFDELTPAAISTYILTVFKDYTFSKDIIERSEIAQNGNWLNYDEMLIIMNNEFEMNRLPFEVPDTKNFFLRVDPSDGDTCELISMKQTGDLVKITLQPPQRYLGHWTHVNEYATDENGRIKAEFQDPVIITDAVKVNVEYTFKINANNFPVLQSGKQIV